MGTRRRLGQNFLVDPRIVDRIVGALPEQPPRVLEIGPGHGALTHALCERFSRVAAVELDPQLIPQLARELPQLELHHADALAVDLDHLLRAEAPWQVAANLPYSVGTGIVRRLLPRTDLVSHMVVMLQREVAERLVALPGDRAHGLLALERAAWGQARCLFEVPPSAFRPRPRVSSAVVAIRCVASPHERTELAAGLRLAAHAMTKPRKMLRNALQPLLDEAACTALGLDPSRRPGQLSLEQWIELARQLPESVP